MRMLIVLISLSCITACSSLSGSSIESANTPRPPKKMNLANENLIHQNITRLANTLFSSAKNINTSQPVAVGTFLPISLTNETNSSGQSDIGLQIQESFITLGTQAGLNIIEYKIMPSIKLQKGSDVMLSRNIKDLHKQMSAQYFLTGTYSEQENSLVVNARLIELSSQTTVAAATDYIPIVSLHSKQQVTIENNFLYRKTL